MDSTTAASTSAGKRLTIPSARRIFAALLAVVGVLISLSLVGQLAKHLAGHTMLKGFVPTFYVDYESNVPTWYSSAALAVAAVLLAIIAAVKFRRTDSYRWHWATLAGLLLALSIDEIAMIHEMPIDWLRERFQLSGVLYYGWVIPGIAFVGLVGAAYLRFLLHLPTRTQRLLVLSGVVFVAGAIGVEMLSGARAAQFGEEDLGYALIVTLEECLEMLGVVILIWALLGYIERHLGGVEIRFPSN